jgi:HlyD family secretion protein
LTAQKQAKISEINTQIEQLESEMNINQSLIKDLKSIQPAKDDGGKSPYQIKIEGLKKELMLAVKPLEAEIKKFQSELSAEQNPLKIQIDKLSEELGFVEEEEDKLTVYATSDGIVGSVLCKVGEQIPAFITLMTLYEENPTQVKGYVLENLMLKVNMGDSISVHASVKDNSPLKGEVIGLGSRIVEIPERLRKNPAFKTYGREVIISIPADNNYLQSEKVTLKIKEEYDPFSFRQFSPPVTASMMIPPDDQIDKG